MDPIRLATELAEALRESAERQAFLEAEARVKQHEAAKIMLEDLRGKQLEMEKKMISGEEITAEEKERLKKLTEVVGYNPYIREYLLAEMKFQGLLMETQKIIASGLGLKIPDFDEENEEEGQEGAEGVEGEEGAESQEGAEGEEGRE